MKRYQKGSFTIEASLIVPMILMVVVVILHILFYYHDKNILEGAAYETAVVGSGRIEYEEEELCRYFRERVRGKLVLFAMLQEEIEVKKEEVFVTCTARRKTMKVTVRASARRTEPEKFIRKIRKIEKLGETE